MQNQASLILKRTGLSQAEIAQRVGVSRVFVSHLMAGKKKPASVSRPDYEREFGIPIAAWDQQPKARRKPVAVSPAPTPSPAPRARARATRPPAEDVLDEWAAEGPSYDYDDEFAQAPPPRRPKAEPPTERGSSRLPRIPRGTIPKAEWIENYIETLMRKLEEDPEATPQEQANVLKALAPALQILGKITGGITDEQKILRSPQLKHIVGEIVTELRHYPEAGRAVLKRLRAIEEGTSKRVEH